MATQQQRELELARARDLDYGLLRKQKRRRLAYGVAILCMAAPMVIDMMTEAEKELEEKIRKATVHSSKKRLSRRHVPLPVESNWRKFYNSGDDIDSAWFHQVALPKQSFLDLVQQIDHDWKEFPIIAHNGDRVIGKPRATDIKRRSLDCKDNVALTLRFLAYPDSRSSIGKEFGILENDMKRYAYFGIFLFRRVLSQHPHSKIDWPCHDAAYVERQYQRIRNDTPDLDHIYNIKPIGWIDGVRFVIHDKWSRPKEHQGDKSNEKKKTLRKLILITDSEGRVVAAGLNTPGSWHDSKATRITGLYDLIDSQVPNGYCILSDTAFRGKLRGSKVIKILKPNQQLPLGWTQQEYRDLEGRIIHARQPSEQANNTIVQAFPRIRQTLGIFDDTNTELMEATLLVHNWRVATSDRNQVKKIFDELEKKAKEFGVAVEEGLDAFFTNDDFFF